MHTLGECMHWCTQRFIESGERHYTFTHIHSHAHTHRQTKTRTEKIFDCKSFICSIWWISFSFCMTTYQMVILFLLISLFLYFIAFTLTWTELKNFKNFDEIILRWINWLQFTPHVVIFCFISATNGNEHLKCH